ncbi:ketoacyl-ACP synthase III [Candidatus Obscuribacterales bacterium]|nr:ketoacyl-ACP synthase III [Candidatus Obscuribacterales bacterium]MBX3135516.1 ketoacyl-ACP synthase III [Candidatus Obscuribacterales bacterium]MBX3150483.1 ketoacyl-ACP synthase III [Candidatus Obscuribacterales bacterium]
MKFACGAKIIGVGAGLPVSVVTNEDLTRLVDTSDEWIETRTGIKERRIVNETESATGLATEAARDALAYAGIEGDTIELVIVATSTPDNLYPSTACQVQAAIGASRAVAFDMEAACTGIIYALSVGQQFIGSGTYKRVLVIGVDVHSRFLNWEDRNTCILFGDGAGAFVLEATEQSDNQMLGTYLRADGNGGHLLWIPNTGTQYPHAGTDGPQPTTRFLQMNGRAIYEFAVNAVPEAVRQATAAAGITVDDIDYMVPHQANIRIIKAAADRLGIKKEQVVTNVDEMGNTSAASIPLALWSAIRRDKVKIPSTMCLVGFGAGLTWGSAVVKWTAVDKRGDAASTSEKAEKAEASIS